ncbi:MAG: cytochrome C [Deltaproteobacteria bacterium]|nr:cytochrome C [Deltaproteobacteria bacterium]
MVKPGISKLTIGISFVFIIFVLGINAKTGRAVSENDVSLLIEKRADIISIDFMKTFGKLERPPVLFPHDLHTEALGNQGKDCQSCHIKENKKLSLKFKRLKDSDKQTVMDTYHVNCINCHMQRAAANLNTGPLVCAGCHPKKQMFQSSAQPMGMDKSLHYRHSKAYENKCKTCHHEYNKKSKKLFYKKGDEASCRYCHKKVTEDNRISMKMASHLSCIGCHIKRYDRKKKAGPVKCSGCHDLKEQQAIKKVKVVPRLDRKQPDFVMIKIGKHKGEKIKGRMNYVPFNHKAHEQYNDTCRICHHENLKACNTCHTFGGSKEGSFINLEQAVHESNKPQSCIGCHNSQKKSRKCAGCHTFMGKRQNTSNEQCKKCHLKPLPDSLVHLSATGKEETKAGFLLKSRRPITGTYPAKDIPEEVIINKLSDKYEPVKFPHRKIVLKLLANIKDNQLARYFHSEKGTLCKGCHHNSPISTKPPECASCHGKPFKSQYPFRPGLMGAYHIQCMECHSNMGIKKPMGCTECHKKKK